MKKRIIAAILLLLLLLALFPSCAARDEDVLHVTVLDVGQGDCVLLSLNGHHALIDTGSAASRGALLGELDRLGVKDLDAIVVTHPHEDHYGNPRVLLETCTVGALYLSQNAGEELGYRVLLETAQACGVQTKALRDGDAFYLSDALCEVLCPLPEDPEPNDAGLVLRVSYGTCKMLFMGDAEEAAEGALLASGADLACDLLKVGHHGSNSSTGDKFLKSVSPKVALISVGEGNDYGHPTDKVLKRLEKANVKIFRTDRDGTVVIGSNGESVAY
jgi:competence protein ComEC